MGHTPDITENDKDGGGGGELETGGFSHFELFESRREDIIF